MRKIAEGDVGNLGDTSTLADPAVVEDLVAGPSSIFDKLRSNAAPPNVPDSLRTFVVLSTAPEMGFAWRSNRQSNGLT